MVVVALYIKPREIPHFGLRPIWRDSKFKSLLCSLMDHILLGLICPNLWDLGTQVVPIFPFLGVSLLNPSIRKRVPSSLGVCGNFGIMALQHTCVTLGLYCGRTKVRRTCASLHKFCTNPGQTPFPRRLLHQVPRLEQLKYFKFIPGD